MHRQRCVRTAASTDFRDREPKDIRVLVVGATGYIGKFVVKELMKRGYNVVAFAREKSGVGGKAGMEDTKQVSFSPARPLQGLSYSCQLPSLCGRQGSGDTGPAYHAQHSRRCCRGAQHQACACGLQEFQGADVRFGSVADMASLSSVAFAEPVDVVVSCLASRTGGKVHALRIFPSLRRECASCDSNIAAGRQTSHITC